MLDIEVIAPVFNEADNIEEFYKRVSITFKNLRLTKFQIIFVNDGSTDQSLQRIQSLMKKDKRIGYLNLSRNFGHQIAVQAGVDFVSAKRVVIIDTDLQDPPEIIEQLFNKMQEGYDVVFARRVARQGESFFKKITAKLFYRTLRKITNTDSTPPSFAYL